MHGPQTHCNEIPSRIIIIKESDKIQLQFIYILQNFIYLVPVSLSVTQMKTLHYLFLLFLFVIIYIHYRSEEWTIIVQLLC